MKPLRATRIRAPIRTLMLTAAAGAAGFIVTPALAADHDASASEAQRLISDSTIDFSHGNRHFYEYFAADGTSRAGNATGSPALLGHWRVRADATVCFLHDDPNQSGCVFVRDAGTLMEFHRIDGVVEGPFKIERGNVHHL